MRRLLIAWLLFVLGIFIVGQQASSGTLPLLGVGKQPAGAASANNYIGYGVSTTKLLSTSPNGVTWTQQTVSSSLNTEANIESLTASSSIVIAGSSNGALATSPDGITWTDRTSGYSTGVDILALFNGAGKYVLTTNAGTSTNIACSSDGITWVAKTSQFSGANPLAGVYGAGTYVIGGIGGALSSSSDCSTWTARTGTATNVRALAFGNSTFVATGAAGLVETSPDGVTWTSQGGVTLQQNCAAFGAGTFITAGQTGTANYSTTNGNTFFPTTSQFGTNAIRACTYSGGQFILVGANGNISTSPDGITYTLQSATGVTTQINAITNN